MPGAAAGARAPTDLAAGHQQVLVAPEREVLVVVDEQFGDLVQRRGGDTLVRVVEGAQQIQEVVLF